MRVLVVEDEKKIAVALKRGLEQESFTVDLAHTGDYGYDLASTEEYDIILLDLMLPGMPGLEICSRLRDSGIHTPILMLTAKSELEDKVKGLECGADDYLTKPFAFEELLARMRALLRRPKESLQTKLMCDDLVLDTAALRVERGGREICLSKKEFSLLEYLIRNKELVLTKDQIIAHVWNYDADILPNTVEQYVGYLRSKIDKNFQNSKPLIKTLRGFGYKISEK